MNYIYLKYIKKLIELKYVMFKYIIIVRDFNILILLVGWLVD